MEKTDSQPPGANLASSQPNGKRATTAIGLADAVEMINSALWYYKQAGGMIRMGNSMTQQTTAILALPGIQMCQNCHQLKLFENIIDGKCEACQK